YSEAIAFFFWPIEEFGNVAQLCPGFGYGQLVAVLGLEGFLFLWIFEPVFAIRPSVGVAFQRNCPIVAALTRILRITNDRGRRHLLGDIILFKEIGQLDVMASGRTRAQPLRVADHHVVGITVGGPLTEGLGLKIGPWRGFNHNLHASLLLVV